MEKIEIFFNKIKKILHWIPFLWKIDDGSFESLYEMNIKQMTDMQKEFEKYMITCEDYYDCSLQMEETKKNLFLAIKEPDIEVAERYTQRAFEIMKQNSLEWWI